MGKIVDVRGNKFEQTKQDKIVIFTAKNLEGPWEPVKNEDVPDWVKNPNVLGLMVNGEVCSVNESQWFSARLEKSLVEEVKQCTMN